jgi:hypothetical protein
VELGPATVVQVIDVPTFQPDVLTDGRERPERVGISLTGGHRVSLGDRPYADWFDHEKPTYPLAALRLVGRRQETLIGRVQLNPDVQVAVRFLPDGEHRARDPHAGGDDL